MLPECSEKATNDSTCPDCENEGSPGPRHRRGRRVGPSVTEKPARLSYQRFVILTTALPRRSSPLDLPDELHRRQIHHPAKNRVSRETIPGSTARLDRSNRILGFLSVIRDLMPYPVVIPSITPNPQQPHIMASKHQSFHCTVFCSLHNQTWFPIPQPSLAQFWNARGNTTQPRQPLCI